MFKGRQVWEQHTPWCSRTVESAGEIYKWGKLKIREDVKTDRRSKAAEGKKQITGKAAVGMGAFSSQKIDQQGGTDKPRGE